MKKITTNKKTLLSAVVIANKYSSADGDFARSITLKGIDLMMSISSTDMVQSIVCKNIPFTTNDISDFEFKELSLDGKKLLTALKVVKGNDVTIEIKKGHILIKSDKNTAKIETFSNAQPIKVSNEGESIKLGSGISNMQKLIHSIDSNNPKFELNGLLFEVKEGTMNMVSTDTRRLAVVSESTKIKENISLILPKQAIQTMSEIFTGVETEIVANKTNISICSDFVDYSSKLISGKFPDYKRILPASFSQNVVLDIFALKEVSKEASIFESDIIISIKDQMISATDTSGNTEVFTEINKNIGADINIRFAVNANYILDVVSVCGEKEIELCFNDSNIPFILKGGNFKEVIMPIVLSDDENSEIAA